jgi:hypothetical protein
MSSLVSDEKFMVRATAAKVTDDVLSVDLEDGRTISVPIVWYPRLVHATTRERNNFEISPFGIHWSDLDEDISVKGLLLGNKSGEAPASLKFWLEQRARGRTPTLEEWSKEKSKRTGRPPPKEEKSPGRRVPKRKAS